MSIPILPRNQLVPQIEIAVREHHPSSSLSLLEIDVNGMSPWYNVYGTDQRERAMEAFFGTIAEAKLDHRGRFSFLARHPYDKLLLYDTGNPKDLQAIATTLKERLDATSIPNPDGLQPETTNYKNRDVDVDPQRLTVRIGVAYQHASYTPYDVGGLVEKALVAAEEAKTAPGQIVVVQHMLAGAR